MSQRILTIWQCCLLLCCSVSTLRRYRKLGLPFRRTPAGLTYKEDEVLSWLCEHRPRRFRFVMREQEEITKDLAARGLLIS